MNFVVVFSNYYKYHIIPTLVLCLGLHNRLEFPKCYTSFCHVLLVLSEINQLNTPLILQETDIKKMVKRYYENCYANKLNNLNEINTFLDNHILSKLTPEERENMNSSVFIIEIMSINKNLPTKKILAPEVFTFEYLLNM